MSRNNQIPKLNNGRVQDLPNGSFAIYQLFQANNRDNNRFGGEALRSIHSSNELATVFFSQQNLDVLQEAIRYLVWVKSCKRFVIDKQSDTEVRLVMRSMYLQYAKHKQYDVLGQIKELNMLVLDFCVPRIVQEIDLYKRYIVDITQLPTQMDRGQFISAKGTKVLEMKSF